MAMARLCTNSIVDTISNCCSRTGNTSFAYRFQYCHHHRHQAADECFVNQISNFRNQEPQIQSCPAFPAKDERRKISSEFHKSLHIQRMYQPEYHHLECSGDWKKAEKRTDGGTFVRHRNLFQALPAVQLELPAAVEHVVVEGKLDIYRVRRILRQMRERCGVSNCLNSRFVH